MRKKIKPRIEQVKKKRDILLMICCCSILIFPISLFLLSPHIELKGNAIVSTNIHEKYREPGYKAHYLGKDISKEIKVINKVNVDQEGIYEVTYLLQKGIFKTTVKRKVKVSDMKPPEIVLEGQQEAVICPNGTYQEEGYHAQDNVDGDVTKNIKVKKNKDEIVYTAKDKAGNKQTVTRKIKEGDQTKPTIELMGDEILFIHLNDSYQEPGYKAEDNCEGNITDRVKVTGSVNTSAYGENELVYEVTDQYNNTTKVKRRIKVIQPGGPGTIYLTFDDGPRQGTTNVILDILKEMDVKATFFVTSNGPDALIQREAAEGHTVGLHTASHNYALVYASTDSYFNDLQIVHDRVQNLTGVDSRIIRFPGGSSNTISRKYNNGIMSYLTDEVLRRGYQYYDWNISSGDAEGLDSEAIYQRVISSLDKEKSNMILLHDIKASTRDVLRRIIEYGKENGYHFEKVTMETEMVRQRVNN